MYALAIYEDAQNDLERLWDEDEGSAATISVLLQELENDQDALFALSDDGFEDEKFNVSIFRSMQRRGLNLWRLKLFEIDLSSTPLPYRIIYAFDGPKHIYYVLAIMSRDQDYENDRELIERLEAAYDYIGIAQLPR